MSTNLEDKFFQARARADDDTQLLRPSSPIPMQSVRSPYASVPPSWASAGIVDAGAFRVGQGQMVHAPSHAGPNRVRGRCGVVARVVEGTRLASWADSEITCPRCRL